MKFKIILIITMFLTSCTNNYNNPLLHKPLNTKGFAYIYEIKDFENKIIKKKLNDINLEIAHNKLRPGSLIKIINTKTNESIILKNTKKMQYPDFYKIIITKPVAKKLNLHLDLPLVEVLEVKKNKSFIAKKTKIFKEEQKTHNNAPVQNVMINNISKSSKDEIDKKKLSKDKFNIIIAEFYSKDSAFLLKKRITQELINFDSNKLHTNSERLNKITLLSGPYNSINLMKNDYILLKNFGFEELDIDINE